MSQEKTPRGRLAARLADLMELSGLAVANLPAGPPAAPLVSIVTDDTGRQFVVMVEDLAAVISHHKEKRKDTAA